MKLRALGEFEVGELEAHEHSAGRTDPKPPQRPAIREGFPGARAVDPEVQRHRIRNADGNSRCGRSCVLFEQRGHVHRRHDSLIDLVTVANIVNEAFRRRIPLGERNITDERDSYKDDQE